MKEKIIERIIEIDKKSKRIVEEERIRKGHIEDQAMEVFYVMKIELDKEYDEKISEVRKNLEEKFIEEKNKIDEVYKNDIENFSRVYKENEKRIIEKCVDEIKKGN